jgi:hypothetical protein
MKSLPRLPSMVSSSDRPKMTSVEFLPVRVSALFDPHMSALDFLPDCPLETHLGRSKA